MPRPRTAAPDRTRDAVRDLGAFYTPRWVADRMVAALGPQHMNGPVLEPAGGDGVFAHALIDAGVPAASIDVRDIDPAARLPLTALGVHVEIGDSLLREPGPARYAVVVGNPPYLNKGSSYIKTHRDALTARYSRIGASETYTMFAYAAVRELAPGGKLVLLLSDTFLTLGIHRKFRDWLLTTVTVDAITRLPASTFPDANVSTVILEATNTPPAAGHQVVLAEHRRDSDQGGPDTTTSELVAQADLHAADGHVISYDRDGRAMLTATRHLPRLVSVLDGGLGMHTGDNTKYLAAISDSGTPRIPTRGATIDAAAVDGKAWRAYHKRGGATRWHAPAEHAVRWDDTSRAAYTIPDRIDELARRPAVAISGVSARLSARLATPGAAWESNKVFLYAPHDPRKHPVTFLLAVLNSAWYARYAATINHTVSLQVRDINALPLLPFTRLDIARLTRLGAAAVAWTVAHPGAGDPPQQARIDAIVDRAAGRAARTALTADSRGTAA